MCKTGRQSPRITESSFLLQRKECIRANVHEREYPADSLPLDCLDEDLCRAPLSFEALERPLTGRFAPPPPPLLSSPVSGNLSRRARTLPLRPLVEVTRAEAARPDRCWPETGGVPEALATERRVGGLRPEARPTVDRDGPSPPFRGDG